MTRLRALQIVAIAGAIVSQAQSVGAATPNAEWRTARDALSACRKEPDRNARLDCLDAAAAAMDDADRKGEGPAPATPEQKRAAERQVFGLHAAAPARMKREGREAVDRVTVQVARASQNAEGDWVMTTTEGAVWRQTDHAYLVNPPRAGTSLTARPGALGSFFCLLDGRHEVRCKRVR